MRLDRIECNHPQREDALLTELSRRRVEVLRRRRAGASLRYSTINHRAVTYCSTLTHVCLCTHPHHLREFVYPHDELNKLQ